MCQCEKPLKKKEQKEKTTLNNNRRKNYECNYGKEMMPNLKWKLTTQKRSLQTRFQQGLSRQMGRGLFLSGRLHFCLPNRNSCHECSLR
jgi:hypothetical protein